MEIKFLQDSSYSLDGRNALKVDKDTVLNLPNNLAESLVRGGEAELLTEIVEDKALDPTEIVENKVVKPNTKKK
jgi:hypothetical protein